MSTNFYVFNNRSIPIVISEDGVTLGGLTTGEVDIEDPRADFALKAGFLSIVAPGPTAQVAESTSSDSESSDSGDVAPEAAGPEVASESNEAEQESEGAKPIRRKPSKEN